MNASALCGFVTTGIISITRERGCIIRSVSCPPSPRKNSVDSESKTPMPVIYQSGYMTIKGYDREFGTCFLGFPNKEEEDGFTKFLV